MRLYTPTKNRQFKILIEYPGIKFVFIYSRFNPFMTHFEYNSFEMS